MTEITAYFCPQIPFNYGPNGYCGLPGMILYVDDNRIVYEVTEIRFGNTEPIHFDQKGIIKSKESFSQFVDSLARATFGG